MSRILLAEDDELLGDGVRTILKQNDYTVDWVKDGYSAEHALKSEKFDMVVLDLGLPKQSGIEVLEHMRSRGDMTPVLILTARDTIEDRVMGLDSGADDFLTKPFDLEELCARLRALQRRGQLRTTPMFEHEDISLDPTAHTLTIKGELINLPRREFVLLQKLVENVGRVLSREYLSQILYGWGDVDSNALEVHIHNLRKKLGANRIRTIRGIGYVFEKES